MTFSPVWRNFLENFQSPSLSKEETVVSIFCSGNLSFEKTNQWNLKFSPSCLLKENSPNFFLCWIGKQELDFAETVHCCLRSGHELAVSIFCSVNLFFRQKQPVKFEIFTFSLAWRKLTHFFCGDMESMLQILLTLSTAFYCQDSKLICPFSSQAISVLDETNQCSLKFWRSHLFEEILLKLSTAPHCQTRKLLCQFFAQVIYLLEKTNPWNLKFSPSRLVKKNSPSFFVLNWKAGVRFCWNFSQLFTVRTRTCCVNFLLSQFIF